METNTSLIPAGYTSLLCSVKHGIGHVLGFGHSGVDNSIMNPWYEGDSSELSEDEIIGVQYRYGTKEDPSLSNNRAMAISTTTIHSTTPTVETTTTTTRSTTPTVKATTKIRSNVKTDGTIRSNHYRWTPK